MQNVAPVPGIEPLRLDSVTGQPHIVGISKTGAAITLTIAADTASAASGIANCIAIHD